MLKVTRSRRDGLYLLLLGTVVFLFLGGIAVNSSRFSMVDFRVVYYSARCLIEHCDPYQESELLRTYRAEGGERPSDTADIRQIVTRYIYLPTAFCFTVPFAMLPWGPAHILWMMLTVGSLILASFLVWNLGAEFAPIVSGVLIGFLLANSVVIVILCNTAGIAVSLCVVAVWCFVREQFVPAGILCLAISLAVKPQDAGLVWLYFLLAGGVYRKRALQTLLVIVALSLPAVLWVWRVAPHWMQEWHTNVLAFSARGGLTDPGPASTGPRTLVDLQVVVSFFRDDPRIYNAVSYLVCASLLVVWGVVTLRSRSSPARAWLAIAAIAALSMLPVYHHLMDTKLLLLTVPACAMLWAQGGSIGRLALLVNTAGFVLTGDISSAILLRLIASLHLSSTGLSGQVQTAVQIFPIPLVLLIMGIFYLCVYVQRSSAPLSAAVTPSGGIRP